MKHKLFLVTICFLFICSSCTKEPTYKLLFGEWKTIHANFSEIKEPVSQIILDRGMEVALAMSIIFYKDSTYAEITAANEVTEVAMRVTGKFDFGGSKKIIQLYPDKLEMQQEDGSWQVMPSTPINDHILKPTKYQVINATSNRLKIAHRNSHRDIVYFTWKKQ